MHRDRPVVLNSGIAVVDTEQLAAMLGYPSAAAVRQAHHRGTLPVPLFRMGKRRRLLARVTDIQSVIAERLEPSRNSPQGVNTKEEAG